MTESVANSFPDFKVTMPRPSMADGLRGAMVLVTGGAGFVGSHVAIRLAESGARVIALDNLHRRGSELNLGRLHDAGVEFVRGDVRCAADLTFPGREIDWIVDCAAEPAVTAGYGAGSRYVAETNIGGTVNCLELAREKSARVVFLSTSRVYPTARLNALSFVEEDTRYRLSDVQSQPGASGAGISEAFPLDGVRTLYGTTKLASELLLEEYGDANSVEYVVNRLGVISGPGQMGKVEQGIFSLVMARHVFGGDVRFIGWGGAGKQVRDVVHIEDVWELLVQQWAAWPQVRGKTFNAGGGVSVSLSLAEAGALCEELTGAHVTVHREPATRHGDVRVYVTDHSAVTATVGWSPQRDARTILRDLRDWMHADRERLREVLA